MANEFILRFSSRLYVWIFGLTGMVALGTFVWTVVYGPTLPEGELNPATVLSGMATLLCACIAGITPFSRYILSEEGIEMVVPWRRTVMLWSSIRDAHLGPGPGLTLTDGQGSKMVVSLLVQGTGTLLDHLKTRIPEQIRSTSPSLRETLVQLEAFARK